MTTVRIPVHIQTVDIANDPMYAAGMAPVGAMAAICYEEGPHFGVHHVVAGFDAAARDALLDTLNGSDLYAVVADIDVR